MSEAENTASIGFLTASEISETGFCGGLLLLNDQGRPLEFHCNTPIRPSRAQEILYGPTLRSFLYAEAISRALIEKCSQPPAAILTDLVELSEISRWATMPIAWVPQESAKVKSLESPWPSEQWTQFEIGGQQIGLAVGAYDRRAEFEIAVASFARHLPLAEPFQRIQLAIEEAQSSTRWRESA